MQMRVFDSVGKHLSLGLVIALVNRLLYLLMLFFGAFLIRWLSRYIAYPVHSDQWCLEYMQSGQISLGILVFHANWFAWAGVIWCQVRYFNSISEPWPSITADIFGASTVPHTVQWTGGLFVLVYWRVCFQIHWSHYWVYLQSESNKGWF